MFWRMRIWRLGIIQEKARLNKFKCLPAYTILAVLDWTFLEAGLRVKNV